MKRDMQLARKVLLKLEESESGRFGGTEYSLPIIEGYTERQVGYHCYLLNQAGLLVGFESQSRQAQREGPSVYPIQLTWAGHDFIDSVRSDTVWNWMTKKILTSVESASFQTLTQLAMQAGQIVLSGNALVRRSRGTS